MSLGLAWLVSDLPSAAQTSASPAEAQPGSLKAGTVKTYTVNGVSFNVVYCPPGTFEMGSTPEQQADALKKGAWPWAVKCETLHKVTLTKGYWMADSGVTEELYQAVMGYLPDKLKFVGPKIPVQNVNFADAWTFCEKLSKDVGVNFRMPTEAEYEYAARAGTTTIYSYGDTLDPKDANFNWGAGAPHKIVDVKSYPPNPWGIYDIPGEHHEWCLDVCKKIMDPTDPTHRKVDTMTVTDTYVDGIVDPLCKVGDIRICRNEGFEFGAIFCRVAFRELFADRTRIPNLGIRIVQAEPVDAVPPMVPPSPQPGNAPAVSVVTSGPAPAPAVASNQTVATPAAPAAPAIPSNLQPLPGQLRIYSIGNSFHYWIGQELTPIEQAAGLTPHQSVAPAGPQGTPGYDFMASSKVVDHWDPKDPKDPTHQAPDPKHPVKATVEAGPIDVITLGGMHIPDEGIDEFATLALSKNPKVIVTLQEFWLPFDRLDYPLNKSNGFGDLTNSLHPWTEPHPIEPGKDIPDTSNFDAPTADQLVALHKPYFDGYDKYVVDENQKLGRNVIRVVPVGQAVIELRRRVIAGQFPGVTKQSELFTDSLGHPGPVMKALAGYCHFIVIFQKDPRGLPLPKFPVRAPATITDEENKILQQIAWDAVTNHPLSGFYHGTTTN